MSAREVLLRVVLVVFCSKLTLLFLFLLETSVLIMLAFLFSPSREAAGGASGQACSSANMLSVGKEKTSAELSSISNSVATGWTQSHNLIKVAEERASLEQ